MITNIRKSSLFPSKRNNQLVGLNDQEDNFEADELEPINLTFDVIPHNPYALSYLGVSHTDQS